MRFYLMTAIAALAALAAAGCVILKAFGLIAWPWWAAAAPLVILVIGGLLVGAWLMSRISRH